MVTKNKIYLVKMEDGEIKSFEDWSDCQKVVSGTSLLFTGGKTYQEALLKLKTIKKKGKPGKKKRVTKIKTGDTPVPTEGICSDGATSGNPGPSEYQVSDLLGNQILHRKLGIRSNNYAELAGIGAMVKYAIESRETKVLWTDSKIAMGWIFTLRIGQTVRDRLVIIKMAKIIRGMLNDHPELELKKWKTRQWGEIPADFGRK